MHSSDGGNGLVRMLHDQLSGCVCFGNQLDHLIIALRWKCSWSRWRQNESQRMPAADLLDRAIKNDILIIGLEVYSLCQIKLRPQPGAVDADCDVILREVDALGQELVSPIKVLEDASPVPVTFGRP
jgi:hypothetical protein